MRPFLLFLLLAVSCWPAAPLPLAKVPVRAYGHAEGLPHRTVFAMAPDHLGRLWAGTFAGIAQQNGKGWQSLDLPMGSNSVFVNANAMTRLADGRLWIGTRYQGILEYGPTGWRNPGPPGPEGLENVNAILESTLKGRDGRPVVWVGAYGKGIFRLEDGQWSRHGASEGLGSLRIFCLLEQLRPGGAPTLLAGTEAGIWAWDGSRWSPFEGNAQLPEGRVRCLAETLEPNGETRLWIGLEERGLHVWQGRRLESVPETRAEGNGKVRALLSDPDSGHRELWVGLLGGGLLHRRTGRWERLGTAQGLPTDQIRTLALTHGGPSGRVLWIGTEGQGILRLPLGGWRSLTSPWPTQDSRAQCFWADSSADRLWVGSPSQGLGCLEQGVWRAAPQVPGRNVRALFQHPGGPLFVGTPQGLGRLEGGRYRPYTPAEGMPAIQVRSLQGSRGPAGQPVLWIGTSRGLWRLEAGRFQAIPGEGGEVSVRTLAAEGERLWVGLDRGLACLEAGQWRRWAFQDKLQAHSIRALAVQSRPDGRTSLWVGTFGGGLFVVPDLAKPEELLHLDERSTPALPHALVISLAEGSDGWIYGGTPRGVFRLRRTTQAFEVDTYTPGDGLPSQDCQEGALIRDPDGRMLVGTTDGLAVLSPEDGARQKLAGPLVFTRTGSGETPLQPGAVLGHRNQGLQFEFLLLSQHREEDTRYRTQLLDLQPKPGPWASGTEAQFPSLPAGSYVFRVWARDFNGTEIGPLEFPFQVEAAPWATVWARLGYLALAAGGVVGLLRLRTRRIARRTRELEATVRVATEEILRQKQDLEALNQELLRLNRDKTRFMGIAAHDLKNPLNAITLISEGLVSGDIEDCPKQVHPWISRIQQAAETMTALIMEFLDITAIEGGQMSPDLRPVAVDQVLASALQSNGPRAKAKGQQLQANPAQGLQVQADPRHLLQVIDNLVSNAVKFSPPGATIRLEAHPSDSGARIRVLDQGPGLSEDDLKELFKPFTRLSAKPTGGEHSTGLGLSIAQQLIQAMGGRLWAENRPEGGACFALELPGLESRP